MSKKKLITLLLALTMILSLATGASAAETTEARVPVTLTVVNTVSPISCTVPACLPVSLVDGYVVCANNAAITNTGKVGAIKVTKVDVQAGTFEIGNFDDFTASKNSIALSINGCATKGAGSLTLVDGAFPAIAAEKNLAIRYKAKVSANEAVTNVNAAISNTGKTGAIRVTKVDVQAGTFEIGNFDDFTASKNSIALSINGCSTKGAGSLTLVDGAFPAIAAEKNLAIRYKAKVSASEAVTNINAATIVFTIAAVNEKEAA